MSIVRINLMSKKGYTPFCGNVLPRQSKGGCSCPKTVFNGKQFVCQECKWVSSFEQSFIDEYKTMWKL